MVEQQGPRDSLLVAFWGGQQVWRCSQGGKAVIGKGTEGSRQLWSSLLRRLVMLWSPAAADPDGHRHNGLACRCAAQTSGLALGCLGMGSPDSICILLCMQTVYHAMLGACARNVSFATKCTEQNIVTFQASMRSYECYRLNHNDWQLAPPRVTHS